MYKNWYIEIITEPIMILTSPIISTDNKLNAYNINQYDV